MSVTTKGTLLFSLLLVSPLSFSAPADGYIDPGENSLGEMAKTAQNPVAAMISVPFQNNTNFNVGPGAFSRCSKASWSLGLWCTH